MKVSIASDHGGVEIKAALVSALSRDFTVLDRGPADKTPCDYPDMAISVATDVSCGTSDFGILVCRSGVGMSMAANRFQNVRAALCHTVAAATMARQHNGANGATSPIPKPVATNRQVFSRTLLSFFIIGAILYQNTVRKTLGIFDIICVQLSLTPKEHE